MFMSWKNGSMFGALVHQEVSLLPTLCPIVLLISNHNCWFCPAFKSFNSQMNSSSQPELRPCNSRSGYLWSSDVPCPKTSEKKPEERPLSIRTVSGNLTSQTWWMISFKLPWWEFLISRISQLTALLTVNFYLF